MYKSKSILPKIKPLGTPALVTYWEDDFPSKTTPKLKYDKTICQLHHKT